MENEKRLIDANALLAELDKFVNPMPNESGYAFLRGIATAITEIEDAPTVESVEVVHGRWIKGKYPGEYTCEHCGFEYCDADPESEPFKHCLECGSKNEQ